MDNEEIRRDLEILSNEFLNKVLQHFNSNGLNVQLETLDFSIRENDQALEVFRDTNQQLKIKKCRINDQGQIVCD